ncbi:MAG: hypothetical protein E7051_08210 [Lentisphaerae bacterium]|nr:hypothetical protein [Lentisphaerota bacterium]
MKKFNLCILTAVSAFALFAAPKRGVVEYFSPELITLTNNKVSISIAPAALGRVVSFKLNETGAEMLNPTKLTRLWLSPLHEIRGDNFQGIRELLWGGKINGSIPMQVVKKSDDSITVYSKSYGASNFEVTRTVTLLPNGFGFVWQTKLTNRSPKAEKCNLWYNFQGVEPALPRIPVAGGTHKVRGKGAETYPRDFMFIKGIGQYYLPPGADYAAFVEAKQNAVWAVLLPETEMKPDGMFYSWGNNSPDSIRTVEPLLKTRTLKSGESAESRMTMLIFPGLTDFAGMLKMTGFEVKVQEKSGFCKFMDSIKGVFGAETSDKYYTLRLVNATDAPAENLEVELTGKKGAKKFSFSLGERKAGTLLEFELDIDGLPETGKVTVGKESGKLFFPLENK